MSKKNISHYHGNFLKEKVKPFEIEKDTTITSILEQMKDISFQARSLGIAFEIYKNALKNTGTIFFGLAGAMVPAGLRKVIVYMIKNRLIDCIVSTGANLFHDVHECLGKFHYKGSPHIDDVKLRTQKIDRIYDVFASEDEFEYTDKMIANFTSGLDKRPYTTREFFYLMGKHFRGQSKEEGIVTSAAKAGIPIYCPAIGDSSFGIALACGINKKAKKFIFNVIKDVEETALIVAKSPSTSVVFIGGGTPKNFIQQTEATAYMMGFNVEGHKYCIQITTDAPHWGGLSGCTFEESQSWGKIHHKAEKITVYCDGTVALPILVSGLAEIDAKSLRKSIPVFTQGQDIEIKFKRIIKNKSNK